MQHHSAAGRDRAKQQRWGGVSGGARARRRRITITTSLLTRYFCSLINSVLKMAAAGVASQSVDTATAIDLLTGREVERQFDRLARRMVRRLTAGRFDTPYDAQKEAAFRLTFGSQPVVAALPTGKGKGGISLLRGSAASCRHDVGVDVDLLLIARQGVVLVSVDLGEELVPLLARLAPGRAHRRAVWPRRVW